MGLLAIRLYPDPVLRVRCQTVEVFDDRLEALAADMIETMVAAPGVGLAAPQVGHEIRLAVVDLSAGEDPEQLHVLVNPEIASAEGSLQELEGCLSIPGLNEKVERPAMVVVRARDLEGRPIEVTGEGLMARALCHEVDHLDGVLFPDRLRGLRRERARRFLKKMAADAVPS